MSGIGGRHSRSTVVHLEVFTNRATHASPLHRFIGPYPPGLAYRGVPIGTRFVPLRGVVIIGASSVEFCGSVIPLGPGWSRSTIGVDGGSCGGLDASGRRRRRPYTDLSNATAPGRSHWYPVSFLCGASSTIIGANLRILRFGVRGVGVVAVDIRGRWWFHLAVFTNRATQASPRPYGLAVANVADGQEIKTGTGYRPQSGRNRSAPLDWSESDNPGATPSSLKSRAERPAMI